VSDDQSPWATPAGIPTGPPLSPTALSHLPTPSLPTAPAGWYSDPYDPRGFRWWDGYGWTAYQSAGKPDGRPPADRFDGLAIAAFVVGIISVLAFITVAGAIALGVVALGLGIASLARQRKAKRKGRWMSIVAIVLGLLAFALAPIGLSVQHSLNNAMNSSPSTADDLSARTTLRATVRRIEACHAASGAYPQSQDQFNACVRPFTTLLAPGDQVNYYARPFGNSFCVDVSLNLSTWSWDSSHPTFVSDYCSDSNVPNATVSASDATQSPGSSA